MDKLIRNLKQPNLEEPLPILFYVLKDKNS